MNNYFVKLKDMCDIKGGKRLPEGASFTSSGYSYVRARDIKNGNITFNEPVYINEKTRSKLRRYLVRKDDICITIVGINIGDVGIVPDYLDNANLTENAAKLSNFKDVYPKYLNHYLQLRNIKELMQLYASGAAQGKLGLYKVREIPILLPPLPIQKKIAAILSAYDDLIENNNRRIAILEKMAEEIYREWFVRMRFPGHEKITFHKGIPEGWVLTNIDNLFDEIRKHVKIKEANKNIKYIGLEHLPRKSMLIKNFDTIDSIHSDKLFFERRDILFGKIRPYLHKVAISHFSGACSTDTIVLRPKMSYCEGFLFFTVFSDTFIDLATISAKGTKMPRADWDYLKKISILQPPKIILSAYQKLFDGYFALVDNLAKVNERLLKSRNLFLPRLLSGKLSVEDLDIKFPPGMEGTDA